MNVSLLVYQTARYLLRNFFKMLLLSHLFWNIFKKSNIASKIRFKGVKQQQLDYFSVIVLLLQCNYVSSKNTSEHKTETLKKWTRTITTTLVTSTACISAQVDAEEFRLTVKVEIIIWCVRGDVVVGDESKVKLEPSVLLVDNMKNLVQTQPMFSCTKTSRRKTQFWTELPGFWYHKTQVENYSGKKWHHDIYIRKWWHNIVLFQNFTKKKKTSQTLLFLSICSECFSAETQWDIFDDKPNEASKSHSQPVVLYYTHPTANTIMLLQHWIWPCQFKPEHFGCIQPARCPKPSA